MVDISCFVSAHQLTKEWLGFGFRDRQYDLEDDCTYFQETTLELDAPYCDVIVDRFQRFTGVPAILERTGESPIPMKAGEEKMR